MAECSIFCLVVVEERPLHKPTRLKTAVHYFLLSKSAFREGKGHWLMRLTGYITCCRCQCSHRTTRACKCTSVGVLISLLQLVNNFNENCLVYHLCTSASLLLNKAEQIPKSCKLRSFRKRHMNDNRVVRVNLLGVVSSSANIGRAKTRPTRPFAKALYRALNNVTKPDRYPIPHIQDFTAALQGSTLFSNIDLVQACVAIPFRLFEVLKMPFGLCNATQTFQRFINQVLCVLPFTYAYIVDLLTASSNADQYKDHLRAVFQRLYKYGIAINPLKCVFEDKELTFLGHHVSDSGIRPLKDKVQAVRDFPQPNTQCKLQEFLGLVNFYHWFLNHGAATLKPLGDLLAAPIG